MIASLSNSNLDVYGGIDFAEGCTTAQEAWKKCQDPAWMLMVIRDYHPGGHRVITSITADILARTVRLAKPDLKPRLEASIVAVHAWANEPSPETVAECERVLADFPWQDYAPVEALRTEISDAAFEVADEADDFPTVYQAAYGRRHHEVIEAEVTYELSCAAACLLRLVTEVDEPDGEGGAVSVLEHIRDALDVFPPDEVDFTAEVRGHDEHIRAVVPICPIED